MNFTWTSSSSQAEVEIERDADLDHDDSLQGGECWDDRNEEIYDHSRLDSDDLHAAVDLIVDRHGICCDEDGDEDDDDDVDDDDE